MKKIFLATFCTIALCTSLTGQMTAPNYLYNITNIPTELPHEIYNQMDAVYTKSANVDFVGTDKSRIGIVYETLDGRSYLYMTNYISDPNNQYLYANNDPFSTEAEVDDNITYEVRHPDIRI